MQIGSLPPPTSSAVMNQTAAGRFCLGEWASGWACVGSNLLSVNCMMALMLWLNW
jgi:hypothetical protein